MLTHEADPQWRWNAVAWTDGGRSLIANRGFADGTANEIWKVDVASGKAAKLLGQGWGGLQPRQMRRGTAL